MFAFSRERAEVLRGLLDYRGALHRAGITSGFQWINGSFVEDIETLEGKAPNDIDVLTFCAMPGDADYRSLFDSTITSRQFRVDAYFLPLNASLTPPRVRAISYWYSMWAHRRDGRWKGFLEIDLNPVSDASVRTELEARMQRENWL